MSKINQVCLHCEKDFKAEKLLVICPTCRENQPHQDWGRHGSGREREKMITERKIAKAFTTIYTDLGFTQATISRAMGKHQSRICDIEAGRKRVGLHFLLDFSRIVRMPLSTIFMVAEKLK